MTFVTTYKQADLALTGTMRKAQLTATATKTSRRPNHHTGSPTPSSLADLSKRRASSISTVSQIWQPHEIKQCDHCHVKFSPVWWPVDSDKLLCHKCHWNIVRNGNGESAVQAKEKMGLLNGIEPDSRVGIGV